MVAALTNRSSSDWARLHAGFTSTLLVVFTGYLWTYGWIGITVSNSVGKPTVGR